jgi:uncharacterized protein DUF4430
VRRAALLALLAVFAAGCGSRESGRATVWVTRDRGATVMVSSTVPAGLTAMQGLERVAKVSTRYGGRYVHALNGVSESGRSSWFYYVNGYLADRSAAEYKLRPGDVEWWDFRSWTDPAQDPVVVGAFPEPFLHGYDGHRRPAVVISTDRALGRRLARLVHGRLASSAPAGANVLEILPRRRPRFSSQARLDAGAPVRFSLDAAFARRLLADPSLARHRYEVP